MRSFALAVQNAALLRQRTRRVTRKPVPEARPPSAARVAYLRDLLAIQRVLEALVRRDLLPLLPSILGQHNATRPDGATARIDATGSLTDEAVERIKEQLTNQIPERHIQLLAQESALRVAEHSRKELQRQINTVAKIDLFEGSQGLAEHIDAFVAENVQLVKSLTTGQLDELKAVVLRGARQGLRASVVAGEIEERFGVSRRRATLIATDQASKLNGELAQLRQQQVGIKHYTWSTSQDERVRKSHRALNQSRQRWDKPPMVDGVHAHPGQPVRCRCQAIPDVDDVLREAGLLGPEGESMPAPASAVPPAPSAPPSQAPTRPSVPPRPRSVPPPAIPSEAVFPTSAPKWMGEDLAIVRSEAVGEGANAGRDVTVREADGTEHRAMWKTQENEKIDRPGVRAGTFHLREAAMYELDQELGPGGIVPPTVSRVIDGKRGSLQRWEEGVPTNLANANLALEAEGAKLAEHPSVRRMFLLDVIAANDDRHGRNVLWRKRGGQWQVSAPDNGLAFPERRISKFWLPMHGEEIAQALVDLDAVSVNQLKAMRLSRVAAILHRYPGITQRQIRETLARIRSLQLDPQQLRRLPGKGFVREKVQRWISRAPEHRDLPAADLAEIDALSEPPK
jgi:SPP1 gp7 family putative phage head morphogenesis protein